MNGPMIRPEGVPAGWFCNALKKHGIVEYRYNSRGRVEKMDGPCKCSKCIRAEHFELSEGPPVQVHRGFPVELLEKKGYVGMYRRTK